MKIEDFATQHVRDTCMSVYVWIERDKEHKRFGRWFVYAWKMAWGYPLTKQS